MRRIYKCFWLVAAGGVVFQATAGCLDEETSSMLEGLAAWVISMALTLQMNKLSF
jgi:hypothetical protein